MSIQQEVELLRNIPLFGKLAPSKLKLLAFTSQRVSFRAGEVIFRQGQRGDAAYVVISGSADVIAETDQGPVRVLTIKANEMFGEVAILRDVPRTATVQANVETTALVISKELFMSLLNEFPDLAIEMMRVLAERLERTTERLRELTEKPKVAS